MSQSNYTLQPNQVNVKTRATVGSGSAQAEPLSVRLSSRLDRCTLLDRFTSFQPAERRLRVRMWDKAGVVQVGFGVYKAEQKKAGCRVLSPEERADNQKRAGHRACSNLRRDLLSIEADRMLTLTYKAVITDRSKALADLIRFNRAMRQRFEGWASVAVLEYQKRGSAHFHLGIAGFYDVNIIREVWRSIVGEGNIDIAFKPDGRGNQYSKLASYMGKYLAKDLDEGRSPGEHRYFRCQVSEHHQEIFYIPQHAPLGIEREITLEIIQTAFRLCGVNDGCIWLSPYQSGGGGYASGEIIPNQKKGVRSGKIQS